MNSTLEELDELPALFRDLVTEVRSLRQELNELKADRDEYVDTEKALQILGIARSTLLLIRCKDPKPGRVLFRKEGRKCLYSRQSCNDYNQRSTSQQSGGLRIAS